MTRDPPGRVKRLLRTEVNFGCPFPGCGNPFLTWHHFDPPWSKREHHEPVGMIALCEHHHRLADRGLFTKEQLQGWKISPNPFDLVKAKFDWLFSVCIVRVGGCYALGNFDLVVHGTPVLSIVSARGASPVLFSMELRDPKGHMVATMKDNALEYSTETNGDLEIAVSSHKVRVWHNADLIGLDCEVRRRTPDQVREWAAADMEISSAPEFRGADNEIIEMNRSLAASLRASLAKPPGLSEREVELLRLVEARIIELENPQPRQQEIVLSPLVKFATEHCNDGAISCVDLRTFNTWINGIPIVMKGGALTVGERLKMYSCLIRNRVIDISSNGIRIRPSER
jgi:hypothetical protein